jgi:hypothetical protein
MVVVPVVDGGAVAVFVGRGPESREQAAAGLAWGVGAGAGEGLVELRGDICSKWERQESRVYVRQRRCGLAKCSRSRVKYL